MTAAGLAQKAFRVLVAVPLMSKAYDSLFYRRPIGLSLYLIALPIAYARLRTWIELGLVGSFR